MLERAIGTVKTGAGRGIAPLQRLLGIHLLLDANDIAAYATIAATETDLVTASSTRVSIRARTCSTALWPL